MTTEETEGAKEGLGVGEPVTNYMARVPFDPPVPCSVCGEPAYLRVNIGPEAGRYFCMEHDPITISYVGATQPDSTFGVQGSQSVNVTPTARVLTNANGGNEPFMAPCAVPGCQQPSWSPPDFRYHLVRYGHDYVPPAPPSPPVRPPQTVPDQVLTPLSAAWGREQGNYFGDLPMAVWTRAVGQNGTTTFHVPEAVEAAIRAPLEAEIERLRRVDAHLMEACQQRAEETRAVIATIADATAIVNKWRGYRDDLGAREALLDELAAALAGVPKEAGECGEPCGWGAACMTNGRCDRVGAHTTHHHEHGKAIGDPASEGNGWHEWPAVVAAPVEDAQ